MQGRKRAVSGWWGSAVRATHIDCGQRCKQLQDGCQRGHLHEQTGFIVHHSPAATLNPWNSAATDNLTVTHTWSCGRLRSPVRQRRGSVRPPCLRSPLDRPVRQRCFVLRAVFARDAQWCCVCGAENAAQKQYQQCYMVLMKSSPCLSNIVFQICNHIFEFWSHFIAVHCLGSQARFKIHVSVHHGLVHTW